MDEMLVNGRVCPRQVIIQTGFVRLSTKVDPHTEFASFSLSTAVFKGGVICWIAGKGSAEAPSKTLCCHPSRIFIQVLSHIIGITWYLQRYS